MSPLYYQTLAMMTSCHLELYYGCMMNNICGIYPYCIISTNDSCWLLNYVLTIGWCDKMAVTM